MLAATWEMILLSSRGLLFGFGIAGILNVILPPSVVRRYLMKPGFGSTLKASAFGLPLPLCSCSVVPVGVALRRGGASRGATASFMISTPEIGVDSFILSYYLLGPFMAIIRTVAAFASALFVGSIIDAAHEEEPLPQSPVEARGKGRLCTVDAAPPAASTLRWTARILAAVRYGYVELLDDLAVVLAVGIIAAAAISALVPDSAYAALNLGTLPSILLMLVISLPLYVCATSSTPLALAFLEKGVPLGAVLTFLLAGPASNVTTMLAIKKELGKKALIIYITGLAGMSVIFGVLAQYTLSLPALSMAASAVHVHGGHSLIDQVLGAILLTLLITALYRRVRA